MATKYTTAEVRLIGDDGRPRLHRFDVLIPLNTAPEDVPQAVTGWRYVMDENGKALPFTSDNLALLLQNYPHAAPAIAHASTGRPAA
jgi:hypothetical protein